MARIVLSLDEWRAIARELAASHTAVAPPGLLERVHALLGHAPEGWPDQLFALELDESAADAVREIHAAIERRDPAARQRAASVAEADRIIHDHQQRS